jgi:hypothetical protein
MIPTFYLDCAHHGAYFKWDFYVIYLWKQHQSSKKCVSKSAIGQISLLLEPKRDNNLNDLGSYYCLFNRHTGPSLTMHHTELL